MPPIRTSHEQRLERALRIHERALTELPAPDQIATHPFQFITVPRAARMAQELDPSEAINAVAPASSDEEYEESSAPSPRSHPANLREISSLASFTVSSYKPGCGIDALRDPNTALFWQSEGPQPHHLSVHFIKMVTIVKIRLYMDFDLDESYTPTKIIFAGGITGEQYGVLDFAVWQGEAPRGWIDCPMDQQLGREDEGIDGGGAVRIMFLRISIMENHQNGKDTHVRGVQIFSKDQRGQAEKYYGYPSSEEDEDEDQDQDEGRSKGKGKEDGPGLAGELRLPEGMSEPAWMTEPVIR